jgi:saccharopine dehydrogenase-like NADP-dependent oxidoreductase
MTTILLLGAGRTAIYLIDYLAIAAAANNWALRVADSLPSNLDRLTETSAHLSKRLLNIEDTESLSIEIQQANLVISLLPAQYHLQVAQICLAHGRHFMSASYASAEFFGLSQQILAKGLSFIKEMGLDPGIDHMSTMHMVNEIAQKGGQVRSYRSYTGGLMWPGLPHNPWGYKFTWNPFYVVTAGRDGATWLEGGKTKRLPYHRLFDSAERLHMENGGDFDAYLNRDSITYKELYGLTQAQTVARYTLRRKGFCQAWAAFVRLGLTGFQHELEIGPGMTYRDLAEMFVPNGNSPVALRWAKALGMDPQGPQMDLLSWTGIFDPIPLPQGRFSPAKLLEILLMDKWTLTTLDKDAIYMAHVVEWSCEGRSWEHRSELAMEGKDPSHTAMALTVGMPLALAAELLLKGQITQPGLLLPTHPQVYSAVLPALEQHGVVFKHYHKEL